jgi:hypothetical protein
MTSVTASGREIITTCEASMLVIVAFARSAIIVTWSAPIALSAVATAAHDGRSFQAGWPLFSANAAAATGRWECP